MRQPRVLIGLGFVCMVAGCSNPSDADAIQPDFSGTGTASNPTMLPPSGNTFTPETPVISSVAGLEQGGTIVGPAPSTEQPGSLAGSGGLQYIWLEAESGAEYDPIVVKSAPDASDAIYLASWRSSDYETRSVDDGLVQFDIDTPTAGAYKLWARTLTASTQMRPYYVSVDGDGAVDDDEQWALWVADSRSAAKLDTWTWSNSGLLLDLAAGCHTLRLLQAEGGPELALDRLLLTTDVQFVPRGLGEPMAPVIANNMYRSDVVDTHGRLSVVGTDLVDEQGDAIQLRGVSTHGLQWFALVDNGTIPSMAQSLGVNLVRLAMYVEDYSPTDSSDYWGGYVADPGAMGARVRQAIDDAIQAGIYVIVDWHIHNDPSNFTPQAVGFFEQIASEYADCPNIIYEIANEPTQVDWSTVVKPYAQEVIATIRQHAPENVIIVGTPVWSQKIDAAALDPLEGDNLMYALHFYAATHDLASTMARVSQVLQDGLPVFISEWGSSNVGTNLSDFGIAAAWLRFMNTNNLSWVNWSLGNKDEASSILRPTASLTGPWSTADLTPAGLWLEPYLTGE